jgi:hypothetical protein
MAKWFYDPKKKTYVDEAGRAVRPSTLVSLRDAYLDDAAILIDDYAANLESGDMTLGQFETEMRLRLKRAYVSEYVLGRGGRGQMTPSDWGRVGNMLRGQYGYLRQYLDDLSSGAETRGTAANRARNFLGSARQSFSRALGRRYGLDLPAHPGDGGTECYGNCFPGSSVVEARAVQRAYRRWHEGSVVTITTARGDALTATPYHPILTPSGWKPLGLLEAGDDVIHHELGEHVPLRHPYLDYGPTRIEDIFSALAERGVVRRVPRGGIDFHGEGEDSEVDVVSVDGLLGHGPESPLFQPIGKQSLSASPHPSGPLSALRPTHGEGLALSSAPDRLVGILDQSHPPFGADTLHPDRVRLAASPWGDPGFQDDATNRGAGYGEGLGDGEFAFSRGVPGDDFLGVQREFPGSLVPGFDPLLRQGVPDGFAAGPYLGGDGADGLPLGKETSRVIRVEVDAFHGYVYNLQTESSWYTCSSVPAKNCRCHWAIEETRLEIRAYWRVGGDKPCGGCISRAAEWSPFVQVKIEEE